MEALEAILTRRSTRRYKKEAPDKELIDKVIEAGRYAPSGSNSQTTHFIVFTDEAVLAKMAELVSGEFAKMEIKEDTYISLKNSINAARKGGYVFHYNAPVFIAVANKKGYGNAMADSACALENMMIAVNALDLGSCWINQLHWLDENEEIRKFMYGYGLSEDETITGGLILGYPESGEPVREPLERKGNPVTWANQKERDRTMSKQDLLDLIDKAGKGSIEAAEAIAEGYFKGSFDGKKNLEKARKWASYAAKHGSEKAAEILAKLS